MLLESKNSSAAREKQIFTCTLPSLFDEYKFFQSSYPACELAMTGHLFGSIIQYHLVDYIPLTLRHSVRIGLLEWPPLCNTLLQIPHLHTSRPDIADVVRRALARSDSTNAGDGGEHPDEMGSTSPGLEPAALAKSIYVLSLLAELYHFADLRLNLEFEIEVLHKSLNVDLDKLEPTTLLREHASTADPLPEFVPDIDQLPISNYDSALQPPSMPPGIRSFINFLSDACSLANILSRRANTPFLPNHLSRSSWIPGESDQQAGLAGAIAPMPGQTLIWALEFLESLRIVWGDTLAPAEVQIHFYKNPEGSLFANGVKQQLAEETYYVLKVAAPVDHRNEVNHAKTVGFSA
ncbi:hypothetical protein BS47DRAFT_1397876 [Hydnum rufescens UP504]|uniref:Uncharacterized protein n=1 Tax=Hydnum rufescens UP504 TaxID=1448309 RepID=A0A9P6DSA4_9AGAM|nr:hypothetical protein BS47DRAFT_1397876 [Hydnum rufescens UP504]